MSEQDIDYETGRQPALENLFTAPGQAVGHPDIYSLQLFRSGSVDSAPVIRLDSNQQLMLRFDMIGEGTRQFRVSVTHHDPDWSRSPLPPEEYMEGFPEAFFGSGTPGRTQRPSYRQYEYRFPNRDLAFTKSGNYMIHVEDFESREPVFALPFFIHENEGNLRSSVETVTVPRENLRTRDIPNSTYTYPDFIDMPRFDLEYYFTQNQFWGRTLQADIWDTATPGEVFYEISREQAFTGDYEVRSLNLADVSAPGGLVREYRPDQVPPMLVLREDVQGLGGSGGNPGGSRFGRPDPDPDARYGNLLFRFQPQQPVGTGGEVYLVGDFNSWLLLEEFAMPYNPESGFREVNTFVKEGSYSYKYVLAEEGRVQDLVFDDHFRSPRQEYVTFVYYRDPARQYYRLLQSNTFYSN
ncbi:MAG: type IX secretion system plug protein domain-containing protein [Balneolaceae bacterium]